MMQRAQIFIFFMVMGHAAHANFKPEDINNLHYIAAVSCISASYMAITYAQAQLSDTHSALVANNYPYAQAWFDEMIQKYPDAHLDKLTFLQSAPWMSQGPMAWQSSYKNVYCPQKSLRQINELYYEKLHPRALQKLMIYQDCSDDEIDLKIAEFLLLRQAYHCINHANIMLPAQCIMTAAITACMMEIITNFYIKIPASYEFQGPILSIFLYNMLEDQELKADEFAYQQSVDTNIFNGSYAYFNTEELQSTLYEIQPSIFVRCEKMLKYIQYIKKDV